MLKTRITKNSTVKIFSYEYDHAGRKIKFKYSLNGNERTIASYKYDATGRMFQKLYSPSTAIGSYQTGLWTNIGTWQGGNLPTISDKVTINTGHIVTIPSGQTVSAGTLFDKGILQNFGTLQMGTLAPSSGTGTLQTVDYNWHIRGSLRGVNLDAAGNLTNKIFSLKLGYEDADFYDGNIGKQEFRNSLDNITRSFTYSYDGFNRIIGGSYVGAGSENYSLNSVTYDLNGNIKTLSRSGLKSNNTFGVVDNLNYTYQPNSNKIQAVTDNSGETASFTDATGTTDYTYSLDGSLTSDANKGISVIEYNYLKLPRRIVKGGVNILYQYDASGKKLKETIGTNITDYVGNKIYKNNVLYQLGHDEGRIVNDIYEYQIKDHLGNLRVAFKDSLGIAKIVQANSYGVWGEDLTTLSYKNTPNLENYRFTGKENLTETGYTDFGARLYDNLVPRWISIDPMSERTFNLSCFVYANGNPINMIDRDGGYAVSVHYDITYKALIALGYSEARADIIAHYSSTYADHPNKGPLATDLAGHMIGAEKNKRLMYRSGVDYEKTNDSQKEENSHFHSMMSNEEGRKGMTRASAKARGLAFGWKNIFAQGRGEDLGKLGQGLHALQDAIAHQGVATDDHLFGERFINNVNSIKLLYNDMYGNTQDASLLTKSALVVVSLLQGKKANIKDGDTLNFQGMSSTQFSQVLILLIKQGFNGTIISK